MGKMLLLSFENSEDDVISEILSILENKQMKICENKNIKKCLEFQGLTVTDLMRRHRLVHMNCHQIA